MTVQENSVLSQDFELGYTYTRSTGPVMGAFYTALRNKKVVGNKGKDGNVFCPPVEFHPQTAEAMGDMVDLSSTGSVVAWAWVKSPMPKHPLQSEFAWAFIQIDGADTPMLHAIKAESESAMQLGMRVQAVWVDEPVGFITDIAYFEPTAED